MAAVRSTDLTFLIVVSGPGRDVNCQWAYQIRNNPELLGVSAREAGALADRFANAMALQAAGATHREYSEAVAPLLKYRFLRDSHVLDLTPELYQAWQSVRLFQVSADTFLRRIHVPVLALLGDHDVQVDWRESERVYRDSFIRAGNPDLTVKVFRNADHNLLATDEENGAKGDGPLVEGYVETMVGWLRKLQRADR